MTQQPQGTEKPAETAPAPADAQLAPGLARLLALIGAGLGVVIYLLGFFGESGLTTSLTGPLLLGGGLLAGAAVLPKVGRVLVPGEPEAAAERRVGNRKKVKAQQNGKDKFRIIYLHKD